MATTPAEDMKASLLIGATAGLASTVPQYAVTADYAPGTGVMQMSAIWLPQGLVVTNLVSISGGTGVTTNTHIWMALYKADLTLMAQSADNTGSTVPAANTKTTFALTAPQTCPYTGLYYIGYMQAATTPALLSSASAKAASIVNNDVPILAGTSGSGLTTTASNPAAALAGQINRFYAYVT